MPKALIIPFITWDTSTRPLLLCKHPGSLNLGIISFSNALATSATASVLSTQKMCPLAPRNTWNCLVFLTWQWSPTANHLQVMSFCSEWALYGGLLRWGLVFGLFIVQVGHALAMQLIIVSCQELPWPQLTNYIGLPSHNVFLDEPPFGDRSMPVFISQPPMAS